MIEGRLYQKPSGWGSGRTEGCGDQRPRGEGLAYEHAHKHAFENRDVDMDLTGSTSPCGSRPSGCSSPTS
jgi:hypothetical protein